MGASANRHSIALLSAAFCLLAVPPPAQATVTLGSSLADAPISSWGCGGMACTGVQTVLPGRLTSSPVNGTVVRWRVRGAAGDTTARLRVLTPMGIPSLFRSSSATVTVPVGDTILTFPTSLSISIGNRVDDNQVVGNLGAASGPGGVYSVFQPQPLNGSSVSPIFADGAGELLYNADVEPTTIFVIGRRFPLPGGILKVRVDVPNPGTLVAGGKSPGPSAASAAGKKSKGLLKRVAKTVNAAGTVTLNLKPAKATRKRLQEKGKAKGKVTLSFTATDGSTSSQTFKAKLKL